MEEKSKDLHHLESPSVYEGFDLTGRPLASIPGDGISTPKYEQPNEELKASMNRLVYSGIILPERYDGSSDPQVWLDDYNDIAAANLWNENDKFMRLISVLDGAPKDWFRNERKRNPRFNWQFFSEGLVEKYTNRVDSLMAHTRIMQRVQGKNEDLNSYWESKLGLIERVSPFMTTSEKISHMFNGLKPQLCSKIISKYVGTPPESLEQFYVMCKRAEDAYSFVQPRAEVTQRRAHFEVTEEPEAGTSRRANKNTITQAEQLLRSMQGMYNRLEAREKELRRQAQRQNEWNPRRDFRDNGNRREPPNMRDERNQRDNRNMSRDNRRYNPPSNSPRQLTDEIRQTEERSRRDLSTIQCYYCKEMGHYANNCEKRERDNNTQKNERRQN
jgi:hypothetical protein